MWQTVQRAALVGIFFVSGNWGAARANEGSPADDVKAALGRLDAWLSTSAGGPAWHKFLKSEQLQAELAKGSSADKTVVTEILAAYASPTPGLNHEKFTAVRKSLEAWIADLSQPKLEELPAAARAAADQFMPLDSQRAAHAKAKLIAALSTLDRWLARSGPKTNEGWKTYLAWEELEKQLAERIEPDLKAFEPVFSKYRGNEAGLELARFTAVRDALREYALALEFSSEDKLKQEFPKQLEELAARLEAHATSGTGEDAAAVGRLVGWLDHSGQAPALVAGVRRHFDRPNLFAHVSSRLLDAGLTEDVDDVQQVQDFILKTDIQGTAHTRGRINIGLIHSTQNAVLDILLTGNSYSDTVGYQGPVEIYSVGNTSIHARKRIYVDANGVHSHPAVANCETSTTINDISAPLRLIENIAWRKAGQSQSQAEEIASGKAELRVAQQMDRRVAHLVDKANASFASKFRNPLLRRGEFPRGLNFSSNKDRLVVRASQHNTTQLAAPSAPPEIGGKTDLSVRVHESLVSNFAEGVIGGETLTDKRLADMMREATGSVPEELQLSPDKDPWSITFPTAQPISAQFSGQSVRIALRGERFTRGENAIKEPMQISATYKIERTGGGVRLERQGTVDVEYLAIKQGTKLSVQQNIFRTFIRRKFNALFKEEIVREDGLKLPGRLEQVGNLQLETMSADKGWLAAAWKMPEKARTAQAKTK